MGPSPAKQRETNFAHNCQLIFSSTAQDFFQHVNDLINALSFYNERLLSNTPYAFEFVKDALL